MIMIISPPLVCNSLRLLIDALLRTVSTHKSAHLMSKSAYLMSKSSWVRTGPTLRSESRRSRPVYHADHRRFITYLSRKLLRLS